MRSSIAIPPPGVDGIDITWLFESPIVRLNRWRCREVAAGITAERQQHWRVIGFVHAGAYELRSPRGTVLIDPLQVAFLSPGEPYQTSHPCGCGDHGSSLIVRDDVLEEVVATRRPDRVGAREGLFPEPSGPCTSEAALMQRTLLRRLVAGPRLDPATVEEAALAVLSRVVEARFESRRKSSPPVPSRAHRDLAEAARRVIGNGFHEPLGLAPLARSLDTTPFHLSRVFRACTGLPVHRYLTRRRLLAATEALARGERDLSGLALNLGFSSHSHFTEVFRREFGIPPSRYRRQDAARLGARIR